MKHLEAEWSHRQPIHVQTVRRGPFILLSRKFPSPIPSLRSPPSPVMDDPPSPIHFSSEELAWLKASEILDRPPVVPPKDSFRESFTLTEITSAPSRCSTDSEYPLASSHSSATCNTSATGPRNSPRPEWIYRQPKPPVSSSASSRASTNGSPRVRARPRPSMGYENPTLSSLSRKVPSAESRKAHKPAAKSFDSSDMTSASASGGPFWSSILRPRSRSERSMPLLRTIPSESQLSLHRADQPEASGSAYSPSTPKKVISSPMAISRRPSSISSTLSNTPVSSTSPSPTSSRSESPITPISLSCSPYSADEHNLARRRHTSYRSPDYRRHRATASVEGESSVSSSSCPPPSKSILTRTASVSTKASSHTVNKTVKFAAAPTVHYASSGYWDVKAGDEFDHTSMGINVESMDLDDDPFANYGSRHHLHTQYKLNKPPSFVHRLDAARVREMQSLTPTPERERERANGLKRLVSINRGPSATTRAPGSPTKPSFGSPAPSPSPSRSSTTTNRPQISIPYALGAHPHPAMQSTTSLRVVGQHSRSHSRRNAGSSVGHEFYDDAPTSDLLRNDRGGSVPLRSAPSMESFRSSKSAAARSVRSLSGSVKSTTSVRGLRAWFERTLGWTES